MTSPSIYQRPQINDLGSLHELTLQNKDFTGSDGITLAIPGDPPIALGPSGP